MNIKALLADDDAVSPVIGVILMVAITVILAAVIGTFVLGLGENVSQNASAGVSEAAGNDAVTLNSLGPSTHGIKCAGDDPITGAYDGDDDDTDDNRHVENIGNELTCDGSNSVVAYGKDVNNATVYTFEEDS